MKTGIAPGTGKLTGRFCVRVAVPKPVSKSGMKFFGCFKNEAAAKKRLDAEKKKLGVESK